MAEGPEISFVTWPDGKVDERSLTVCGERIARERFIAQWLPEQWFGKAPTGYAADGIWREANGKGFRVYTIKIGDKGEPSLVD